MKIVFCGGGTAGHVTPNLALIDLLQNEQNYYVGSNGMEKNLTSQYVEQGKIEKYLVIPTVKMQRKFTLQNLEIPFKLMKSIIQAKKHLKNIKPDVVFSKGGYVGLPVTIAASALKVPVIIHESDMTVGLANKISSVFSERFLSAYPCTKKSETVGAIIRQEILHGEHKKGLRTMQFDGRKPVLVVMGGSLGAKALNDAICNCKNLSNTFDIFVICGQGKTINCSFVHQAEFVTNVSDVLAAATICLTRGGSTSLAELTLAQVPFIAVPLTKCSRGEQVKNAKWFAEHGCGIRLDEDELDEKLEEKITLLYNNRHSFRQKQKQLTQLYGTEKVAEIILSYKKSKTQ